MSTPLQEADDSALPARREKSDIRLISRISAVFRFLSEHSDGVSLGQIAKGTGIPRGTVQRLIDSLDVEGMISRGTADASIRLGLEIARLGMTMTLEGRTFFRPILEDLAQASGETADLTIWQPQGATVLDQIASPQTLRVVSRPGQILPTHATASGKAHLRQMSPEARIQALNRPLAALTAQTRTDPETILRELAAVPEGGMLIDREEYADGICAIAIGLGGTMLGNVALSLSMPAARFDEAQARCAMLLASVRARLAR